MLQPSRGERRRVLRLRGADIRATPARVGMAAVLLPRKPDDAQGARLLDQMMRLGCREGTPIPCAPSRKEKRAMPRSDRPPPESRRR